MAAACIGVAAAAAAFRADGWCSETAVKFKFRVVPAGSSRLYFGFKIRFVHSLRTYRGITCTCAVRGRCIGRNDGSEYLMLLFSYQYVGLVHFSVTRN